MSAAVSLTAEPVRRLVGFDTAGEPFVSGDRVLRGIFRGNAEAVREVLSICERNDLFSCGIVQTRELQPDPHPELGYEMVLEHRRIPFVTYPHEWPASMFRDAALFHIDLFKKLAAHGLTLKDWHPYNILFEGTVPVFVDFTSIVKAEDLERQPYLSRARDMRAGGMWNATAAAIYEMYRLTFEPYFGLPLAMMQGGRVSEARMRLFYTTLNAADSVIARREAFVDHPVARARYELDDLRLRAALAEKSPAKQKFFSRLRKIIADRDVAVTGSAYSTYYEEKREAFSVDPGPEWTNKQRVVHDALKRFAPETVLDLGCNTGWFSLLAAKLGSSVVAVDLDEACVDRLYATARRDGLRVLPLVANLTDPLPELFARSYDGEPSLSLIGGDTAVIRAPAKRLRCDMVMALAVVHHLALGQGLTFGAVASILSDLSSRYLCVEFIAIEDRTVANDPWFFPSYNAAPADHDWYTRDNFVEALRKHFTTVEALPSFPDTRTMLVCTK